jgi:hypothetical protein
VSNTVRGAYRRRSVERARKPNARWTAAQAQAVRDQEALEWCRRVQLEAHELRMRIDEREAGPPANHPRRALWSALGSVEVWAAEAAERFVQLKA